MTRDDLIQIRQKLEEKNMACNSMQRVMECNTMLKMAIEDRIDFETEYAIAFNEYSKLKSEYEKAFEEYWKSIK